MVGEVRVVGSGAKKVEDGDDVEGKNGGLHAAALQKGGETTVEEDTEARAKGQQRVQSPLKHFIRRDSPEMSYDVIIFQDFHK